MLLRIIVAKAGRRRFSARLGRSFSPNKATHSAMSFASGANRVTGTEESVWVQFTELTAKYGALNLGQGFPDFAPPRYFTDQLSRVASADDYRLHQYTRGFGYVPLVEALARFYTRLLGRAVHAMDEVLICGGAYQALFYSALAFLNEGDQAIIMEPFFDCYDPQVRMAGGKPIFVPLRLNRSGTGRTTSAEYVLDIDQLERSIGSRTKLLYLNNPMNPTGKVFSRSELEALADVVRKHSNLIVVADEVYEWLAYDGEMIRFATLPGMWERTITIGSVGKTFSLTGWKLGWAICPSHLMSHLRSVHQNCIYTFNTAVQAAVTECFAREMQLYGTDECYFAQMPRMLRSKRDDFVELLSEVDMEPIVPEGGYFMVADYSKLRHFVDDAVPPDDDPPDYRFVKWLCANMKLTLIPMSAFYSKGNKHLGQDYVRFCFYKNEETFKSAKAILQRLTGTI